MTSAEHVIRVAQYMTGEIEMSPVAKRCSVAVAVFICGLIAVVMGLTSDF